MDNIIAKTLATVERERERERESIFLAKIKLVHSTSHKLNEKIKSKDNINKLKIDSNKKPVIDTG